MNQFVKLAEMEIGKEYSTCLLIKAIEEKLTNAGKPYCIITLCDGKDEVKAKIWNSEKASLMAEIADVIYCQVKVSTYNNSKDYTINSYRKTIPSDGIDIGDFTQKAPLSAEFMYEEILKKLYLIKDESLNAISTAIYKDYKEQLLYWSAAKGVHHNYLGGLLYHTYRMITAANQILMVYNLSYDSLIAGIALHDIGKLKELDTNKLGEATYTTQGYLEGHLVIGMKMVEKYAQHLGVAENPSVEHLEHIILSHHGSLEFGSPVKPQTTEAMVVHMLDDMDAKIFQFEKYQGDPGTITSERPFGLGVKVYTPVV